MRTGQYMGKVLVLGNDNRSFLSVIRSLGRRNICVHVAWCARGSSALHSKYIAKVHHIPFYSSENGAWKDSLVSVLEQEHFDLVIPCHDSGILALWTFREELQRLARVSLPNEEALLVAFDKVKTDELVRSLGIARPRAVVVTALDDVQTVLSELQLPMVVKPRSSFALEHLASKNYVTQVKSADELLACVRSCVKSSPLLVQEHVRGAVVGIDLLAQSGHILFAFQHTAIGGRSSGYRTSVSLDPELLAASAELVKAQHYTGPMEVEFLVDFETGRWVFLEMNARFCGVVPLALACGAETPYYLYQLLVHGKRDFRQDYRTGIACRNLLMDLGWMYRHSGPNRDDPLVPRLRLWQVAENLLRIITFQERSDSFVCDDPMPGLVELGSLARKVSSRAVSKLGDVL